MIKGKILVTGAAGFIGSHLVDLLLEEGCSLSQLVLVIAPWDSLENLQKHKGANIHKVDIRDSEKLDAVIKGCDYIFHLAAKIDFDGKTYNEYREVNVIPVLTILKAAHKYSVKKCVFFSSIGVHGLPAGIGNIVNWNENHAASYTNFYGKSKWQGEQLVEIFHRRTDLPFAIIRPASVYGPREKGPTLALYKAIQSKQFAMIGDGSNKMHYVYVKDLVTATYLALKSSKKRGAYIIGGPRPEYFKNIVLEIAHSINATLLPLLLPVWIALPLSAVLQFIFSLVGKKAPLYPERVRTMTTTYYYDITKARSELGYTPQFSFHQGAQITGKWYKENGYL
jgi:nucleoside-diphosphate-sugar epimerase